MTFIDLFIPDSALCSAVTEQLRATDLGEPRAQDDLAASLQDEAVVAIVIDQEALNKKYLQIIKAAESTSKYVFVLGEPSADDSDEMITECFAKPLRLGQLIARLQFYIQLAPRLRATAMVFGPYRLEPQNRQIVVIETNDVIRLTEKETVLLEYLGKSDTPVGREELLAAIWGYDGRIDTHTLETHIYQLRRKLDPTGEGAQWLLNEQGSYRLNRGV